MKKIESIEIKMTFKVGLGGLEVPDNVYETLNKLYLNMSELDGDCSDSKANLETLGWLDRNIKTNDAFDWVYEVEEFK